MRTVGLPLGTVVALAAIASLTCAARAFAGSVPIAAPEIDPGAATGGISLLIASVLLIREHFRNR